MSDHPEINGRPREPGDLRAPGDPTAPAEPRDLHRYHRQMLLPGIGRAGQVRLGRAHALIVGCGALGSVIADTLARAGVGTLTIVDRDLVEITNLQRQVLFDQDDVERGTPKAIAAAAKIARINPDVTVHAHVDDFGHGNAERLARGCDIIMDGLDNFETRYVLNDLAVKRGLPYVYGGAVAATGVSMTVLPHPDRRDDANGSHGANAPRGLVEWSAGESTPCLRCIFPEAPPPGSSPTCDTAGVLAPVVLTIAAHQAAQAIKLLTGNLDALDRSLLSIDAWANDTRRFDVRAARESSTCACCVAGRFDFLEGKEASATTTLCGRNAVQITKSGGTDTASALDLGFMSERLAPHGRFEHNQHLLRGTFTDERGEDGEPIHLTLFPNGRAILKGTSKAELARAIYAKYVGT